MRGGAVRGVRVAALVAGMASLLAGCTSASASTSFEVVASTPIIADFVRQVAPDVGVTSIVPQGTDPHTFEPSMRALREVAHAHIAFSNGLLLEDERLNSAIDANLPESAAHIRIADEAPAYGAKQIHLVEDQSLESIWLGFRVVDSEPDDHVRYSDSGAQADSSEQLDPGGRSVRMYASRITGPGHMAAFTTGTFGAPSVWMSDADGLDASDSIELPTNAHTHMSWGFSAPGEYELVIGAQVIDGQTEGERKITELGEAPIRFVVGQEGADASGRTALNSGHVDITATTTGGIRLVSSDADGEKTFDPDEVVVEVPNTVATMVPDPKWSFLGDPGQEAWILAQAVLGKHVHGEIDPHMWHDISNAIVYVEVIRDRLAQADPSHASEYVKNAEDYIGRLRELDRWERSVLASIPPQQRKIVTAHDSFGYLAGAYGLEVAGFVAPNPTLEPSPQTLANLGKTLRAMDRPAIFLDPTTPAHANELLNAAENSGAVFCELYSDALDDRVSSYVELVEFNVQSLKTCLDPGALPAWQVEE